MADKASTVAGKILHNSFWYGLETILETAVFLGSSIVVARYLGPTKLGYFSYINFFVTIVTRTSGSGLASATRKYMSEYLALDRPGTARAVYYLAYYYQLLGAILITVLGVSGVLLFGDPQYKLMTCLLILSILPGIMSWVPAQANQALEVVSGNTFSACGYMFVYAATILLTLHFHWDLIGVASASLVGRSIEVILRTIPLHKRLRSFPIESLDPAITTRIRQFCIQAIGIQLLMSVVWDRSEMIFLRAFSGLEQIAFYSVSFSLASNLLLIPRTFGSATGITLMVEAGRDPASVKAIVWNACRYLLLVVFPVHLGAAAITAQAISFTYGARYAGAVTVLIIASILSIPRAFQEIPEVLLRAADRQKRILVWFTITGVLNLTLDALLIPRFGAVGAAWANGTSQAFGIIALWVQARRFYDFQFPVRTAIRLLGACMLMAFVAFAIVRTVSGLSGLSLAVLTAAPVYIILVKIFGGLHFSDRLRLAPIGNRLPGPARRLYLSVLAFATPAAV